MKKRKLIGLSLAAAAVILTAAGCGGGGDSGNTYYDESRDDALVELASASNTRCTWEGNDLILTAQVRAPRYEDLMERHHAEAEANASNWEDYEKRLYDLMLKDAKENNSYTTVNVTVNLSYIDPSRTEWSDNELETIAEQAAFDEAAEDFAMAAIMEGAPSFEEALDE